MSRDIMLRNWRFHLLLLVVVAFSCQRYKDDVSFDDKIVILENSPESRKHTIFRLDAHYSQPYLCAVTFKNNDYGKRKSNLSGGI